MASKKFTEEEMNHLRASSYVLDVSPSIVHFTAEFKKKFWEAILAGKKPRDIVIEMGIDPDILGEIRMNGLKGMIKNEVKAGKGFRDLDTYNKYLDGYITPEGRIKYLEQQLAYKEQEIEFLKKIVSLGREVTE
ncbi:MAG: HTH domain-containing protein [Lutisporaceae bacterium]